MGRIALAGFVLLFASVWLLTSCEVINVGNVGIKINRAGSNRGPEDTPTVTGYVFYNPFISKVLEYPVYMQTAKWEGNEELSFNSNEGVGIQADISLSYQLEPTKVPSFYAKFRSDDLDNFTHGYLRNAARDAFNDVAGSNYTAEQILGPKKEAVLKEVSDRLNKQMASIGVSIQQLGFLNAPRPPDSIKNAITAKIAATQQAVQVENELRRTEAEAKKSVAQAEGQAKTRVALAEAEAQARVALAEADAKANDVLSKSINQNLLEWQRVEVQREAVRKWNGQRPQVEGSTGGLMMQLATTDK